MLELCASRRLPAGERKGDAVRQVREVGLPWRRWSPRSMERPGDGNACPARGGRKDMRAGDQNGDPLRKEREDAKNVGRFVPGERVSD